MNMKNSQKGFIVPLLVVIVILVIGGGVYLFSKKSANPQSNYINVADTNKDIITSSDEAKIEKTIHDLVASLKALDVNAYLNTVNGQDRSEYTNKVDKGLLRDLQKTYMDSADNEYPIKIISIQKPSGQLPPLSAGRVAEVKLIINGVTEQSADFVKENEEWKFVSSFERYDFSKNGQISVNTNSTGIDPAICARTDYKMAFVIIAKNQSEITTAKVNDIKMIQNAFAKDFSTATNGLARMDTSYQVVTIINDGTLIKDDNSYIYPDKVTKKFYENNPDTFDFISIYPTFVDFNTANGQEIHVTVKNNIKGISTNGRSKTISDQTAQYGSKGRLLGINVMPNIEVQSPENAKKEGWMSSGLLHEQGHQWCCGVGDNFARGADEAKLEIIQEGMHFYRGLASPSKNGDPMNSDNWVPNGDGTYRRDNQSGVQVYHPFQLYFMGLLPKSEYSKKYKLYDAGIVGKDFNDKKAKFYKEVSVEDIIKVAGERQCVSS